MQCVRGGVPVLVRLTWMAELLLLLLPDLERRTLCNYNDSLMNFSMTWYFHSITATTLKSDVMYCTILRVDTSCREGRICWQGPVSAERGSSSSRRAPPHALHWTAGAGSGDEYTTFLERRAALGDCETIRVVNEILTVLLWEGSVGVVAGV